MGKTQKKTGKGRIDKFYKLAKEQGYRARSAFKLIQLNKKYGFLESARCCIDLCAAPGGWLQVASKYMPPSSLIVGVDLVPIKSIPKVTTFAADITTPQCRTYLRSALKDWKADVVLHDGAPNVGTAWVQDAYAQSELVLMSLKLAVEFLMKGGTFVTKVFRSTDYNNLMWVFGQLFAKVEATKPPASRNVSAEIFVVCREFYAPKYIDPKFLDPKHVFKDLAATTTTATTDDASGGSKALVDKSTSANNVHANVFMPEKKRRRRDGYDEGDYTLYRTLSARDFIYSSSNADAISGLGTANRITFESEEERRWKKLKGITTAEVLASCEDLKVLGKGDFKMLIKWRTTLREEIGLESKTKPAEELTETVAVIEEVDEDEQIQGELERLNEEAAARAKRERRRMNEKKTKTIQRMQLSMVAPMDIGQELDDPSLRGGPDVGRDDIFDLKIAGVQRKRLLSRDELLSDDEEDSGRDQDSDEEGLDSEEDRERRLGALEDDLDGLYDAYRTKRAERDAKFKAREERKKNKDREEAWGGIREKKNSNSDDSDSEAGSEIGGWEEMQERKRGEGSSSSDDDSSESESDGEDDSDDVTNLRKRKWPDAQKGEPPEDMAPRKRTKTNQANGLITTLKEHGNTAAELSRASKLWFSQDIFAEVNFEILTKGGDGATGTDEDDEEESSSESDSNTSQGGAHMEEASQSDIEIVPRNKDGDGDIDMWVVEGEDMDAQKREYVKRFGLHTAEAMTLAQQLVNREKTRNQLINDGFNRYSLNSKEGLPDWFLDDESKHYKPNLPITKEAVMALRAKQRELDARPIKKVAEAKARKKFKAAQRLEKAMKKAEGVNATSDMTEKEKSSQIEQLMRKGLGKNKRKKDEVKLVVAKGSNKGMKGRPKGVKGRYRMVDSRGKKELRAQKRREKARKPKRR